MWLMVGLGFMMIVITVERLRLFMTTRVDAPALARGLVEALVATAVGLVVAIPCVALFNMFKAMLKERVNNTEFLSRIVLASANRADGGK